MAEGNETPKAQVVKKLAAAQQALSDAYHTGVIGNAMAADLPVFIEMREIGAKVAGLMQQVSKVRGL